MARNFKIHIHIYIYICTIYARAYIIYTYICIAEPKCTFAYIYTYMTIYTDRRCTTDSEVSLSVVAEAAVAVPAI